MKNLTDAEKRRNDVAPTIIIKNLMIIVAAAVSLFSMFIGVLYDSWVLMSVGIILFAVVFGDIQKALYKRGKNEKTNAS